MMQSRVKRPCGRTARDKNAWEEMVAHLYREAIAESLMDRFPTAQARRAKADQVGDLAADLAAVSRLLEANAALETTGAPDTPPVMPELAQPAFQRAVQPIRQALDEASVLLVETGVATVLENSAALVASGLEVDDLSDDLAFLLRSEAGDARADLRLHIQRLRQAAFRAGQEEERVRLSGAVALAKQLHPAGPLQAHEPPPRKRRWWKALAGFAKGSGMIGLNGSLLLAGAPIPLATPAVAVAVVGSFMTGLEGLATGVSDLGGE
jgi:hypothetical protein